MYSLLRGHLRRVEIQCWCPLHHYLASPKILAAAKKISLVDAYTPLNQDKMGGRCPELKVLNEMTMAPHPSLNRTINAPT